MRKGFFITFEGIDGCGKSTQCQLLAKRLEVVGNKIITTCEPGGTLLGAKLRNALLESKENTFVQINPLSEALLFAADRVQHIEEVINPALKQGQLVLCDRYIDSTKAYQGYGRSCDFNILRQLINLATNGLMPDLTFLFDLSAEEAQFRINSRNLEVSSNRFDMEKLEFHKRIRQGYLELAAQEPNRIKILNANFSIEQVSNFVWQYLPEEFQNQSQGVKQ